ncbi:quinone-dependent dihydroorotate dehydrogenase [Rhodoligotrophos appendicifer]|uniref:quinone-dependent dihydroorotate dehydrogenase n=1 Tax=Rhodoligotrophos appendicifer TaxID=987056 RepID=UPI003D1C9E49
MFPLFNSVLQRLDPESAHKLTIAMLKAASLGRPPVDHPVLGVTTFGLSFPNPVGIAAGFDKNAEVARAMTALGFGFAEVGTVTPKAQEGNPKPRIFRLREDNAVINRLGFNNKGHAAAFEAIKSLSPETLVGVNIGANKDSKDRIDDYVLGVRRFAAYSRYLTINISSPNTPGLRDLQATAALVELLERVLEARHESGAVVPILLKISPDLTDDDLQDVSAACLKLGVDGMIVSNTTITRPALRSTHARETGGLSGAPLFVRSTRALARVYLATGGKIPLIGVGGITSAETAIEKIKAGATLVQLYTGLIYKGPALITEIKQGFVRYVQAHGLRSMADATGSDAGGWANREA